MRLEVLPDAEGVAHRGAAFIAQQARAAVRARGQFSVATSGGRSPWRMFELLAGEDMPWARTHLFQVDERVTEPANPARTSTRLHASLLGRIVVPGDHVHAMPVDDADLPLAAAHYAATLREFAGAPPILDLVQLGLGIDGHTASLFAGDLALESAADVAVTGPYAGFRRMTLTFPVLNRARSILWTVSGAEKSRAIAALRAADPGIPAARVRTRHALLLADADAAAVRAGVS